MYAQSTMTLRPKKVVRRDGKMYYSLVDKKRVNGKVVQKYVGYPGKPPNSKNEIEPEILMQYVQRLLNKGIGQDEIGEILKKWE